MSETKRILDQLKRAYEGEAWHGPSLRDILADVFAQEEGEVAGCLACCTDGYFASTTNQGQRTTDNRQRTTDPCLN